MRNDCPGFDRLDYFLFSVRVPLDSAGPVPPPSAVPAPCLPLDATVPDSRGMRIAVLPVHHGTEKMMLRFLLGALVGAAAAATWLQRPSARSGSMRATGRVDELSSAAHNVIADPSVNAGDGTPDTGAYERRGAIMR